MNKINDLKSLAQKYRREIFEKMVQIQQGHPGSIFSMMDITVALYHCGFLRFDKSTKSFSDKLIISKGHATAATYPILKDFGVISEEEWNNWGVDKSILRVFGNTSIPGIDITSGSFGHGIGSGAGMAIASKSENSDQNVYVIISEGELYEGSTWESLLFAKHHNLNNLKIIIDINSLIILGNTRDCLNLNPIREKISGLGINCLEINGHSFDEIISSLKEAENSANLSCILANTIKGKGSSIMENKKNWHYWNKMSPEEIDLTLKELK